MPKYYIMQDGARLYKKTKVEIAKAARRLADATGIGVPVYVESVGMTRRAGSVHKTAPFVRNPHALDFKVRQATYDGQRVEAVTVSSYDSMTNDYHVKGTYYFDPKTHNLLSPLGMTHKWADAASVHVWGHKLRYKEPMKKNPAPNKYHVELHKTFTGGNLKGLSAVDYVDFPTWEAASQYAEKMRGKNVRKPAGGSPYQVDFAIAGLGAGK